MALEATYSKYRQNNLKIFAIVLLAGAAWLAYDGYRNDDFINKHKDELGNPDSTLVFHRKAPPYCIAGSIVAIGLWIVVRNKKIVAGDEKITLCCGKEIEYGSMQKIEDNFKGKGFFTVYYNDPQGNEQSIKFSDKSYDGLEKILELLKQKMV